MERTAFLMNLRDLVYVVAVADYRNFTRAAEAMNVSQPALSSQIKKLEAELGVEIFARGKKDVRMTEFGERLVHAARQINELAQGIGETAQEYREVDAIPLRLGMTPTLAAYLSRYFLDMIAELYPQMRLIIVEEYPIELAQMVEEQKLDAALIARKSHAAIFGDGAKRVLDFFPLWLEPLFLGVRQGHNLARQNGIWAKDVPSDLLIRFDISFGYDLEKDLPASDPKAAEIVGIDVRNARFETVCRHVAQSDACTIINAIAAIQFNRDNIGLSFIPFLDDGNLRELGAITRPEYSRQAVVDAIQAYIESTPPPGTLSHSSRGEARAAAESMLKDLDLLAD
ncbi:MAG: LysR family transcriptional regulator [Pseudomonadota bacterium]